MNLTTERMAATRAACPWVSKRVHMSVRQMSGQHDVYTYRGKLYWRGACIGQRREQIGIEQ